MSAKFPRGGGANPFSAIRLNEDVIRLSKEESAKHWLSVAGEGANEETSSDMKT